MAKLSSRTALPSAITSGDKLYVTRSGVDYRADADDLPAGGSQTFAYGVACSDLTTALTTGTSKGYLRMPHAATGVTYKASVLTAPTGANIIVDVNVNTLTVLSTKLSIDATEKTSVTAATAPVLTSSTLSSDDEITFDIDQIGSTIAGAGLIVWVLGTKA